MRRPAGPTVITAIALTGLLTGMTACGEEAPEPVASSSAPTATSTAAPTSGTSPAQAAVRQITVTITKGKVRPSPRRVKVARGATVRITVTSDVAEEFHLHGYDKTVKLAPGKPGVLELAADTPGVFEAELHGSGARLFELQVG